MYKDLKKIFHTEPNEVEAIYEARFHDSTAVVIGLREEAPFFYWTPPDLFKKLLAIERLDKKVTELAATLPATAVDHYVSECMIDEIILTNDIEGVISTRKQIEAALDALKKQDRRRRFQGIANKYNALFTLERIPLATCEDLRELYDDLVLDEVIAEDPTKAPDGTLFRTDSVSVVDATGRIIHENNYFEKRIIQELAALIGFLNNVEIEPAIRAAIFHFAFAYIHPFYDGNGRTNRFISSYLLMNEVSRFAGLRLSFSVKENIGMYYSAFTLAEHSLSKGDLTPFVLTFLDIVLDALQKTYEAFDEKKADLEWYGRILSRRLSLMKGDLSGVGEALLEGALFTSYGLTVDSISNQAAISIPTVHKRLKEFKEMGLLERTRSGRRVYYQIKLDDLIKGWDGAI